MGPSKRGEDINRDLDSLKTKRDGTKLRMKEDMLRDYDSSNIPWPIKPFVTLDYCWRVTYLMWKHSFILAGPLTMIHFIWTKTPHVWQYKLRTLPKLEIVINYFACVLIINSVNMTYSALFEDYW